jgi:hypothetical protein
MSNDNIEDMQKIFEEAKRRYAATGINKNVIKEDEEEKDKRLFKLEDKINFVNGIPVMGKLEIKKNSTGVFAIGTHNK